MTRSRPRTPLATPPTPLDAAMTADEQTTADQLSEILAAIAPFDQGTVKGVLYQKPIAGQGSWKWIDEVFPPFDLSAIYQDMKENYGGGDYQLRVFAGGKPRKNHDFTIIKARAMTPLPAPPATAFGGGSEFIQFMLTQSNEARRDAAEAAQRQMDMFMLMSKSQSELMIAAMGGKGGGAAETIALITALQERKGGGSGLKETLEAMAAFKTLMGPQDGGEGGVPGLDMDDLVTSGGRLIGPALKALGDYVARQRGESEAGGASASGAAPPSGGGQLALDPPASRFRIIDLVRVDVVYGFERGHDPEKIAELVYDVIEANKVTAGEINELAAAFALSPTGLDDLAGEGIDLRARPGWAAQFFAALNAIHSEQTSNLDGGDGSPPDVAGDGAAGAQGDS